MVGDEPARSVPERPLLKPWYRLALDGERAVLRYGGSVLELEGRAAAKLLPLLLPLLDGTHTVDEIVGRLGEPVRPAIEAALGLLAERRLLTEAAPDDLTAGLRATGAFLSATDPLDRPPLELCEAIGGARACVVGSGRTARRVLALLHASGSEGTRAGRWEHPPDDDALTIVAPAPDEVGRVRDWNRLALSSGAPWLQVLPFDGMLAAVGPLFVPGETACHECYRLRRNANLTSLAAEDGPPLRGGPPSSPAVEDLLASLAALAAIRSLALGDLAGAGVVLAVELTPHVTCSTHVLYRVPRCEACSRTTTVGACSPWSGAGVAA